MRFSDISVGEIVTAARLLEASFKPDALDQHVGLPLFCDISDDELPILRHPSVLLVDRQCC